MNKSTDKFSFPVRIYDSFEVDEAEEKEKATGVRADLNFIIGRFVLPIEEVYAWCDIVLPPMELEEARSTGFNGVIVYTKTLGIHNCPWTRKRFEEAHDEHIKKYDANT